jgi:indole-3-glycerol phosphate synthase
MALGRSTEDDSPEETVVNVPTLHVILDQVLRHAEDRMDHADLAKLEQLAEKRKARSFRQALLDAEGVAVIAEMKRASPSAGALRLDLVPKELAISYESGGADALSVVTCPPFFHGKTKDLTQARSAVELPVLCKDFILTRYQLLEAAAAGADAVLLIAAAVDPETLEDRAEYARELGLEILYEVHTLQDLETVLPLEPTMIGVNSRNLARMVIEPEVPLALAPRLPENVVKIYESGIRQPSDALAARDAGYQAILVGESLLVSPDPATALFMLKDSFEE